MPIENALAAVAPSWLQGDLGWPSQQGSGGALGSDVTTTDESRTLYAASIGEVTSKKCLVLLTGGAGYFRPDWLNINGVICGQTQGGAFPSAMYFGDDFVWYGPTIGTGLSGLVPEPYRVQIKELYVSWTAAAPVLTGDDKPLVFIPTAGGGLTNTVLTGILGAQYGIRGAGAGALEWFTTIGGVEQEAVALAWPEVDLRYWVKISAEHITATPTANAKFNLYLNDVLAISRDWEAGTTLPTFSDAVAGTGSMMRSIFYQGANVNKMNFTMIRCREGQFDFAGVAR